MPEGNAGEAPLKGVRVVELSQALAAPFAGRMLSDLGAEVIKVEPRETGEAARRFGPQFVRGESYYFLGFNRNKKGLALDLRHAEGRQIFLDLARVADVVLENFRPGVMDRLGIGYEALKAVNPAIIFCSISGFGQDGPWSQRPAFDSIVQALGGLMSVTGEPGRPPVVSGFPVGDIAGGYAAVVGILTALFSRERSGQGRRVDISLLDVQVTFQGHLGQLHLSSGEVPGPQGSSNSPNVPVGAFPTKDGLYILVQCTTQKFWENLAAFLAGTVEGLGGLPSDPRFATQVDRFHHREELNELLIRVMAIRTRDEWLTLLQEADVPAAPILNLAEVAASPQVQHRRMVVEVPHPKGGTYTAAGNPIKLEGHQEAFGPPPTLGQDNEAVLRDLLGYSAERIERLRTQAVF